MSRLKRQRPAALQDAVALFQSRGIYGRWLFLCALGVSLCIVSAEGLPLPQRTSGLAQYPGRASAPSFLAAGYENVLSSADTFYAEAIVERTSPGTFYTVLLGEAFYFGLQHGGSGYNKHVHFAVWDPADPLVFRGSGVDAQRFGGEGTGWTTYYPFEWKTNVSYGFLTQITRETSARTLFRAYFYDPESGQWKHLVTVRRLVGMAGLNYFGSFIEDFGENNSLARSFRVGRQWARHHTNQWIDLRRGFFNCSIGWSNPYTNSFDGDVEGEYFRLETGGQTVRDNNPGDVMLRAVSVRPTGLPVDPPQLGLLTVSGGNPILELSGAAGLDYQVEYSSDLNEWSVLSSLHLSTRSAQVSDPPSATARCRYYRSSLLQP
jgi:hypothetical protein